MAVSRQSDLAVPNQFEESTMYARIVGQFGMKSCGHGPSLPYCHRNIIIAFRGDDVDAGADALDFWRADENHLERRCAQLAVQIAKKFAFANGTVDLASVGVAADGNIDCAESGLAGILDFRGEQDGSGARAEGGLEAHELLELVESFVTQ